MPTYRQRPPTVDAIQYTGDVAVLTDFGVPFTQSGNGLIVGAYPGAGLVDQFPLMVGDWVLKRDGMFSRMLDPEFTAQYELAP